MIKTLTKIGIEGTYLNIIEAIYDKPTVNTALSGENLKAFLLNSGTTRGCPISPLLFKHSIGSPSRRNQTRKRKRIQIGRQEVKLSLYTDDTILYIENPKDSTQKLLELINAFSKVKGYKLNVKTSVAFLYANNEITKRKFKKKSHLKLHQVT